MPYPLDVFLKHQISRELSFEFVILIAKYYIYQVNNDMCFLRNIMNSLCLFYYTLDVLTPCPRCL